MKQFPFTEQCFYAFAVSLLLQLYSTVWMCPVDILKKVIIGKGGERDCEFFHFDDLN